MYVLRDTLTYPAGVRKGEEQSITFDVNIDFTDLGLEKTLMLYLYDDETDELLSAMIYPQA